MHIFVVGNVTKDVYLNLDPRTERFETDKNGTSWLDLEFDASEHHFFSRAGNFGGIAVTLETLQKLGLHATSTYSSQNQTSTDPLNDAIQSQNNTPEPLTKNIPDDTPATYRYILVHDGQVSYFTPSEFAQTDFTTPNEPVDYLYIDRSAKLTPDATQKIASYLNSNPDTKLVVYLRDPSSRTLAPLLPRAALVFTEDAKTANTTREFRDLDPSKNIRLSDYQFTYLGITEPISVSRINVLTHLSLYSIASATILGSFILGYSVEDSLKLARLNVENSQLDSTLSLDELQELSTANQAQTNLELIAKNLLLPPKGILAADESGGNIHQKFEQLGIDDTYENRRDYRNLLFTTPDLDKYINGIILFDETARQIADNGQTFTDFLTSRRIIPGIKVDQGLAPFKSPDQNTPEETYTKGLENLNSRLQEYYQMGLRFAKWRAAFTVQKDENNQIITPTDYAIEKNCQDLAKYAKLCQNNGLVPIVEPELVYDGNYDIDQSAEFTGRILDQLFKELQAEKVNLRACVLKVNMVLAGKQQEHQSTPEEVGAKTAETLKKHVPEDLAGVVFLSGGQTPDQATANLAEVISHGPFPWPVTFSFSRALQAPALEAWHGNPENTEKAHQALLDRLIANTKVL